MKKITVWNEKTGLIKEAAKKRELSLIITGTSMEPLVKHGWRAHFVSAKAAQEGDIIIFKKGSKLVCHRLILKIDNKHYTKGDNLMQFDKTISTREVLGKLAWLEDKNGIRLGKEKLKIKNLTIHKLWCIWHILFSRKNTAAQKDNNVYTWVKFKLIQTIKKISCR